MRRHFQEQLFNLPVLTLHPTRNPNLNPDPEPNPNPNLYPRYLIKLLLLRGYAFNRSADFETVRKIKVGLWRGLWGQGLGLRLRVRVRDRPKDQGRSVERALGSGVGLGFRGKGYG